MRYDTSMSQVLAVIPARSGSKTVPNKNIRPLAGKPLIVHSIEHALGSPLIDRVIVSTDSEQYAAIARAAGADVPFLRPDALAQDHSTDLEVFLHALRWLEEHESYRPDICVHLRPTCPLRRMEDIDAVIRLLLERPDLDSVRTVSPAPQTPFKMWFMQEGHLLRPAIISGLSEPYNLPRQALPSVYLQNACIDAVRTSVILHKRSMTGQRIYGYLMEDHFDIDTHDDIRRLEDYLSSHSALAIGGGDAKLTLCFDIDGVIASIVPDHDYERAQPQDKMISLIRLLHEAGHRIILHTARGSATGKDWRATTERQMEAWGVPYDALHFGKPAADIYIDDRAIPVDYLQRHPSLL